MGGEGRGAMLAALCALLVACGGGDSLVVDVRETNDSGIWGRVELEAAGERTSMTVKELYGGTITGVRVMADDCANAIDDKYAIRPPAGVIGVPFELLRDWNDEGPLAVAFLRRGRYVACGEV